MKKILLFAILVLITAAAFPQNSVAPAKEDAVNFIRKVYKENMTLTKAAEKLSNINVELNNCTLKIITLVSTVSTNKEIGRDTIYIDLSAVKVSCEGQQMVRGNIPVFLEPLKNHALYHTSRENLIQNNKSETENVSIIDVAEIGSLGAAGPYARCMVENLEVFKKNGYPQRLFKAYDLLIKACGGGNLKVDTDSKF